MKNWLFFLLLPLVFIACTSSEKLLEQGKYERLINLTTKKLSGKKKKDVDVHALEKGFEKLTQRDMARIERLRTAGRAEDWEDILAIAHEIQHRQDIIEPFLPLISESGYQAKFSFVKTNIIADEALKNAVALYKERVPPLVASARTGHKKDAREAYSLVKHIEVLDPAYRETNLAEELWGIGVDRILVRVENNSFAMMPARYEDELLSSDYNSLNTTWSRYYTQGNAPANIDYEVVLRFDDIRISPEGLSEREQRYTREIKDGWEYVLDHNGNVAKDSLGNDIKRDKYIRVNASVVETLQSKQAYIRGQLEFFNAQSGLRLYTRPLEAVNDFNFTARKIYGDMRALDENMRFNVAPIPFPNDLIMITDALKAMKPKLYDEIRNYRFENRS